MHELYRDSNGKEPAYPRYYRNAEKKLAREQRKLSKMQKGSNNRNKHWLSVLTAYAESLFVDWKPFREVLPP